MSPVREPDHERTRPLIARIWRATGDAMRADLDAAGHPELRPAHNVVLSRAHGRGARITDMAAAVGTSKVAVTLLVDQLEELGFVERVPDPADGRAKLVRLTRRGRRAATVLAEAADAVEERFRAALGANRLGRLREDLTVLVLAVEA
ncbi:MAG: MarR family transcriptional regulator [Acidimicrobiales bacterium]